MKRIALILIAILLLLFGACSQQDDNTGNVAAVYSPKPDVVSEQQTASPIPQVTFKVVEQQPQAKYVFFFIGDGMGQAHTELSEAFLKYISGDQNAVLNLNSMEVSSMVATRSANAQITDSAAAATALSSGVKTDNGVIGQTPEGENLKTVLEAAKDAGFATGIISTARITHATPACFYSHVANRSNENEIALQLLDSDIDFIAGGGLGYFLPQDIPELFVGLPPDTRDMDIFGSRNDDINHIDKFADKGYEMFLGSEGAQDLLFYDPKPGDKVFAPLTYNYFPYEIDRLAKGGDFPSLSEITKQATRLLSLDEEGFFLMVEGGRIDYAAHNNDALGIIYDTLAFDNAVGVALSFYEEHPNETLIIVTADHETGGLSLGSNYNESFSTVSNILASYGDKFGLLYDPAKSFDEFVEEVKSLGLNPDENELSSLRQAFDEAKNTEYSEGELDTAASLAINKILNHRIDVSWATDYHTPADVALSVSGVFSNRFETVQDNTEVAIVLADILGFKIGR